MERVWWIIAFGSSVCLCGYLIHSVWAKWDESPVIVSLAEKSTHISEKPFPAVTICPETKARIEMLNFTDVRNRVVSAPDIFTANISEKVLTRLEAVSYLCPSAAFDPRFSLGTNHTTETLFDIIREVAPLFNDTMKLCYWRNTINCVEFFRPILTEEGACFTFNALNSREIYTEEMAPEMMSVTNNMNATEWNLEDGYKSKSLDTYPYRVLGASARAGLRVGLILFDKDLDYACRVGDQGFKVVLHTPGEVPQVSKHFFRAPLKQEVSVSVKPNIVTTSEGLRYYEPNRRQCYFDSERQLRFFKVYTQRNCKLECLSNYTVEVCGCVKFSLPRNRSTPICGVTKIKCYDRAENMLLKREFTERVDEAKEKRCNCLPTCHSITYDTEISQQKIDPKRLLDAFGVPDYFEGKKCIVLSIFFKENEFIMSKRSERYGLTDFLAYCGGLLGLFMGISVLSVVEVIYYFTLRLGCTLRFFQKREKRNAVVPVDHNTPGIMTVGTVNGSKDHQN